MKIRFDLTLVDERTNKVRRLIATNATADTKGTGKKPVRVPKGCTVRMTTAGKYQKGDILP